jgi:hypothetical protein
MTFANGHAKVMPRVDNGAAWGWQPPEMHIRRRERWRRFERADRTGALIALEHMARDQRRAFGTPTACSEAIPGTRSHRLAFV